MDFRRLLRWRKHMIKYFGFDKRDKGAGDGEYGPQPDKKPLTQEDLEDLEDEKLEADVRELFDEKKRERRKAKRKKRQAKIKDTRTMLMGGIKPDDIWELGKEQQEAQGLFNLGKIRSEKILEKFLAADDGQAENISSYRKRRRQRVGGKRDVHFVEFEDSDDAVEAEAVHMDTMYEKYKKTVGKQNAKEKRDTMYEKYKKTVGKQNA